jgi:hypothetical protein
MRLDDPGDVNYWIDREKRNFRKLNWGQADDLSQFER